MTARARASVTARRPRSQPGPIYLIRLRGRNGSDDIRSLRAILKTLLRQHRLRCIAISKEVS
jgi:hypothetical protein